MKEKFNNYLYQISALGLLVSAALYILKPDIMSYIFAVCAAGFAVSRLNSRYTGGDLRIKRLFRIQKMAGLLMVTASYFMFKPHNQWVPILLIAAFLELYTSFVLHKAQSKG